MRGSKRPSQEGKAEAIVGSETSFSSCLSPSDGVPSNMHLSDALKQAIPGVYKTPLTAYDLSFGTLRECKEDRGALGAVAKKEAMAAARNRNHGVSIAFVVRNPG